MRSVNIHDAKTHLSRLLEYVNQGEEIIIGKAGKPIAKLIPYHPTEITRKPGYWKGKITINDDFDELPKEISDAFNGTEE